MVTKHFLFPLIILMIICSSGCGLLYTNVTKPLSRDFNTTPIGSKKCTLSTHKINLPLMPLTTSRVSAEWDTEHINEAAQKAGITKIYYADLRTQEILLSTYRRSTLIIYGD
jgi:hypothetical protein